MALTSKLGTYDSMLGNIQLAGGATLVNLQTASNTLALSQTVQISKRVSISVGNTLALTQSERDFQSKKFAANTFIPSQTAAVHFTFMRSASSTIAFTNVALADRINVAANTLTLSQAVAYQKYMGTYSNLVISQALSYGQVHNERPLQVLGLSQTVSTSTVRNFASSQTIGWAQTVVVKRVRKFTVTNTLFFSNTATTTKIVRPSNALVISQAVTYKKIMHFGLSNLLTFQQAVNVNKVLNIAIADSLTFLHNHRRDSGLADQPIYVPDVIFTKVLRQVIYQTPSSVLALRQPEFGDSEGGASTIVSMRSITGILYTYARRSLARKIKYKFLIGRPKSEETRKFIRASLSTPMYMTNWKGELWYGFITNNPFNMSPKSRRVPCDDEEIEIEVEFEGVRVH